MRLLIQHRSRYHYPSPAVLGAHTLRLKPAPHTRARVETYRLQVEPEHTMRWQQDPAGNHVARLDFPPGRPTSALDILVELALDIRPVNPFDFKLDPGAERIPIVYSAPLRQELAPFLSLEDAAFAGSERFADFDAGLEREGATVELLTVLNRAAARRVRYVIRDEPGVFTPEECLRQGRGSCRDSAVLLCALFRRRGVAARFVSGYLVQLADEGMIPDQPRGVSRDVVDLHAWCEVFLPGAGWIGLDPTSGLVCGEGHIPLCGAATPSQAAPLEGTSDVGADEVTFQMTLGRLGHEPSPAAPYPESVWDALGAAAEKVDARLSAHDIRLTIGGEPTFNSRDHAEAPEWNGAALGATKWTLGRVLAGELRGSMAPGAVILHRQGKHYPGESVPRWALEIIGRRDGRPLWPDRPPGGGDPRAFVDRLAARLGAVVHEAFEDPRKILETESALPPDVDPRAAGLDDPEERQRLARILDRGVGRVAGWVLPLAVGEGDDAWRSETWTFRRGRLFLLFGDSPLGLRLPLASLGPVPEADIDEPPVIPPDPRQARDRAPRPPKPVRTALCVEPRDDALWVYLPPLPSFARFCRLVEVIDAVRDEMGIGVALEGYPPPSSPEAFRFSVTPDPGVLEVNIPPSSSTVEYARRIEQVFDAALRSGLHSEKYLLDGRMAGSGGGHHITLGGPTPLESPFLRRPDLLASLLTFLQHHPSLSYLFAGLFIGPTSQAPRVDEARHETLYELEIALARAFEPEAAPPAWLSDRLFRHLLVDMTGNTHRAEVSIDKLFDPATPHGRQGLIELRAFEMPPHPRMVIAQGLLARALVAAFAAEPYRAPLVRWGQALHDRFLLPSVLWRDFEDVLSALADRGVALPAAGYRPFLDLRCPQVGMLQAGDVTLEVSNALEPWHVLGEELTTAGTARFVDSSVERIEVLATGLVPGRHVVLVNGHVLPLHATPRAGTSVGGVRFRAWAPPHSLHAHLGIHHPIRLDVVDAWAHRSLGGCAYHVWHPEGRAYDTPPLTRFEAAARRAQRFRIEGPAPWPVALQGAAPHDDVPFTLDLRRLPIDRPMPEPTPEEEGAAS